MIDFNIYEGSPTINDDASMLIQQIDLLFDTAPGEVCGATNYGTKYDEYLYNLSASNDAIAYQIQNDLESLNLLGFIPHVDVSIYEGTLNDIILVKISLERQNEYYEKTYKLQ